MSSCIKGHWYSCIPTVDGHYDLILKSDGDGLVIFGVERGELAHVFKEAGSSLLMTIKLFDEPSDETGAQIE